MCIYVGQLSAKLQTVKVGDLKKNMPLDQPCTTSMQLGIEPWTMGSFSKFDRPQLCSPLTHSTSLENIPINDYGG